MQVIPRWVASEHARSCSSSGAKGAMHRQVKTALAVALRALHVYVPSREPHLTPSLGFVQRPQDAGTERRADLLAYIGNDCFTIDVCVSSAYHNVPASSKAQVGCAANLVARAKRSTYAQHFSTMLSSFVAFAVEPYGAMGEEAYGFVMTLVRAHARALFPNDAVAAGRAIHTFRQTLSLGMALALSQSLDTLRLGPRPPAASPLRRSPPRAPRHQRQSYSAADLSRSYTTTSAHRRVRATAAAQAAAVPSQTDDSSQSADSEPDEETSSHSSQPSAHGSYVSSRSGQSHAWAPSQGYFELEDG